MSSLFHWQLYLWRHNGILPCGMTIFSFSDNIQATIRNIPRIILSKKLKYSVLSVKADQFCIIIWDILEEKIAKNVYCEFDDCVKAFRDLKKRKLLIFYKNIMETWNQIKWLQFLFQSYLEWLKTHHILKIGDRK